ncbi:MAG: tRNA (adenosine(37)-N6)-threonylcarbamoyltransferase complex transferase subunit TsaD [Treponema sp.]|jgi:N6-L-threonylcarbamoyladenine synthase|nr:tRNA (adenosine(37)-N6)-threonylcarbamoyltransferase complex transferase subunit TsaD [Treponema sp.]
MTVLGIESSCDECAAAVVEDGERVLSSVVATQIPLHAAYGGVVPELASRAHTEWISAVVREALDAAAVPPSALDAVAATSRPGLLGSLIVGLSFGKAFAWARRLPFIAVDHMLAHLYASRLTPPAAPPEYPFLGLLVSGGHSIICRADAFDQVTVLGATIDDAVGEAFDKVAAHYGLGYPGGAVIDRLARHGNPDAFRFPLPRLYKPARDGSDHRFDFSYSGLKTAVIHHLARYSTGATRVGTWDLGLGTGARCEGVIPPWTCAEDIAASFEKAAVDILVRSILRAADETGLRTLVAGGGAAANTLLRERLAAAPDLRCVFPPPSLCGDNAAMVAGLAYHYLARGDRSPLSESASARVSGFKRRYP